MSQQPTLKLSSGYPIPALGFGTYEDKPHAPGNVTESVKIGIAAGYRHIDCAFYYADEEDVGRGIQAKIADGTVTREELFITSKIWPTHMRPPLVKPNCLESMRRLGIDYLDLYLIHWPMSFRSNNQYAFHDLKPEDVDHTPFEDNWKESLSFYYLVTN